MSLDVQLDILNKKLYLLQVLSVVSRAESSTGVWTKWMVSLVDGVIVGNELSTS